MASQVNSDTGSENRPNSQQRWLVYVAIIAIAMTLSMARLLSSPTLQSANDRSRWCTVWSLAERGTYVIDEIRQVDGWDSIDIVRHEGHFYSTKPPLFPTMVAGVYWTGKYVFGWNLLKETDFTTDCILILVNLIPMAIGLILLASIAESYSKSFLARVMIVVTASFATLLTPFLIALNNHTIAASALMISLWSLQRIVNKENAPGYCYAMCGFFAAFTCCNELPAALFGIISFVVVARADLRKTLVAYVPAALVPLVAFFVTTSIATGGWKPFYMYYGTEKYVYTFEGVPSYWCTPKSFDKGVDSPLVYFLHCTIGHHGIFSLSPIYLLMLMCWLSVSYWLKSRLNILIGVGILMTLAVVTFYMTRTSNYNYGGNSVALRWTIWLTPFWLISLIPIYNRLCQSIRGTLVIVLLLALSSFSAWYPYDSPWKSPWLYHVMHDAGWLDQYTEKIPDFDPPKYTWFDRLPSGDVNADYWVIYGARNRTTGLTKIKLADGGPVDFQDDTLRKIVVSRWKNDEEPEVFAIHVNVSKFNAGQRPEEYLHLLTDTEPGEREQILQFLRGLPNSIKYRQRSEDYLKFSLRTNAFRCKRGYAYVNLRSETDNRLYQYRRDIWLNDEIPFGAIKWVETVSLRPKGEIQERHLFEVFEVGKFLRDPNPDSE